MEILVLIIPLVTSLLFWLSNNKKVLHYINIAGSALLLLLAVSVTGRFIMQGLDSLIFLSDLFYFDYLNLFMLDTIVIVSFLVSVYAVGYLNEEFEHGLIDIRKLKLYYSLTHVFIFTMVLVVSTQNLGLMWIAIEATTLASVFLVGFHNNKNAIEAAWKYIIICSVGIALALLGIVLLYISTVGLFGDPHNSLSWVFLYENALLLQGSVLKISFIFVLAGFGTKVGLVPMHTWLPDAHSQAPSPISALLSGVLLNSAMYGIIRVLVIINKNLGSNVYTGRMMMAIGLLSIAAAALFILPQKDYKRLLAYSSIEHMGIIAFALGIFSPLAVYGALFHMLNHAFTKSMLFLCTGNIFLKYKTREISKITGVLKILPVTGVVFLLGIFAIAGMPPFSVFASELNIIIASFEAGHYYQGAAFIILLALVFAGITSSMLKMFFANNVSEQVIHGEVNKSGTIVVVIMLCIIAVTGLYLPEQIGAFLSSAAAIVSGGM